MSDVLKVSDNAWVETGGYGVVFTATSQDDVFICSGNSSFSLLARDPQELRCGNVAFPSHWDREQAADWRLRHFCNGNEWSIGR